MKKLVVLLSLVLIASFAWAGSETRNGNPKGVINIPDAAFPGVHAGDYNR